MFRRGQIPAKYKILLNPHHFWRIIMVRKHFGMLLEAVTEESKREWR
jgi:hypothetical protein